MTQGRTYRPVAELNPWEGAMPSLKSIVITGVIAVLFVALANNIGLTRGLVTPASPRF